MCRFVLTGALIVLSVISGCVSAPGQPDPLDGTALDLLENIRNVYEVQRQSGEGNAGLCKLCEELVAQLMTLARNEIRKQIKVMCNKLKHFKQHCFQEAKKYEVMVIHRLFHGSNAKESCKSKHLC